MAATSIALHVAPPPIPAHAIAITPRKRRTTRRERPATLLPNMRVSAWKVDGELGRGGMASVYAVTHTEFGKRAALKLAHRAVLGPDYTRETFLREARIVHLVDHAGLPDVFATGSFDTRPYMVMERLAGVTLGQRVDTGTLGRAEGLAVMRELCEIVGAAHAAGVVHRDIKLDNVFLEDGRRVRLLDWGVARVLAEPDPFRGMIAGTLTYVAPEQIVGEDISPAADVYSLGVLAYHVLLGRPPFSSPVDLDLIRKHLHEPAPRPETLWPEIPDDLARVLYAMLAKDPARRPALAEVQRVFAQPLDRERAARAAVRWRRSMAAAVVAGVIAMASAATVIA